MLLMFNVYSAIRSMDISVLKRYVYCIQFQAYLPAGDLT